MLDFSFGEILVIAIVAVIFLGPDKLPQTFVRIAKFFRAVKKTINDAKDTLDREIHITEMKQDVLEYKKKFEDSALKLKDDILESVDLEGVEAQIKSVKNEIESLKVADKLNEPLEISTINFDEVEQRGKALQNKLKKNLKDSNDLGDSKVAKGDSKGTKKVAKSSTKKNVKDSKDMQKKRETKKESKPTAKIKKSKKS